MSARATSEVSRSRCGAWTRTTCCCRRSTSPRGSPSAHRGSCRRSSPPVTRSAPAWSTWHPAAGRSPRSATAPTRRSTRSPGPATSLRRPRRRPRTRPRSRRNRRTPRPEPRFGTDSVIRVRRMMRDAQWTPRLPGARYTMTRPPEVHVAAPTVRMPYDVTEAELIEKAKLQKHFGRFDILFFLVCTIVGVDTIGAVASYGAEAFTWLIVLAAVFFIPSALLFAELGTAFPEEGGPYVWTRLAFGRLAGAINN